MKIEHKMFVCECETEAIVISKWFDDSDEASIGFAVWGPKNQGMPWKAKLRRFWDVLVRGHMYVDDIILSRAKTMELAGLLEGYARKGEK